MLLATTEKIETNITFGRFFFSEKGIKFARNTLKKTEGSDIVVIDELGPLECMEEGFLDEALDLVKQYDGELILVIREECLNTIFGEEMLSGKSQAPLPVHIIQYAGVVCW